MTLVLIVDDHEQNLYMLQVLLQGQGYEVRSARNGIEALGMARRQAPDLIITDILMPGMDGFSLCREWMADERLQHVPLVFYTATYTDPKDEAFALSLGAARFIVKPTEPDAFVEILRQVLENNAVQRLASLDGPSQAAEVYYQQYNQALIRKLEDKMAQLKEANRLLELDIAERKQAEKALRDSETRYRRLFEAAQDGILLLDADTGQVTDVNPFMVKMLGYSHKEYRGKRLWEIDPFKDIVASRAAFEELQRTGYIRYEDLPLETKEGRPVSVEFVSNAYLVDNTRVIQCNVRDITKRKRAEKALRESEERYRTLFENAQVGIYRTTPDGRVLAANPALIQMLGHSSFDELAARNLEQAGFEPDHPRSRFKELIERQGEVRGMEGAWKKRDDSVVWVRENARAVRGVDGAILYYEGTVEDITERRRAEEARLRSETKYRSLVETTATGIATIDSEGKLTFVNQALCEMVGHSGEELLGRHFVDFLHPEDIGRIMEVFQVAAQNPDAKPHLEFMVFHKDGHVVHCYSSPTVLWDQGQIIGFNAIIQDITERKWAEEALREREQRLTSIYDTVGDIIFQLAVEKDGRYRFASVNSAFLATTGLTSVQVVGKRVDEVIPEPSLTLVLEKYRKAIQEKRIVRWEETSEYPTGRLTGEVSVAPVFDSAGNCTHLVGAVHDITERKRAEKALRESEDKFKYVFDYSAVGKSITLPTGEISVNKALCDMLGYTREELQNARWQDITHPEDIELTRKAMGSLLSGEKESVRFVKRYMHKGGAVVWTDVSSSLRRDKDGKPLYFMTTVSDITEHKRAEEEIASLAKFPSENPNPVLRIQQDGILLYANEASYALLRGWQLEIGKPAPLILQEAVSDTLTRQIEITIDTQHDQRIISFFVAPVVEAGYANLYGRDVTERKRAEEALRESEAKYRQVVERANDGIVIARRGKLVFSNKSFAQMSGYSVEELDEIEFLKLVLPEQRAEIADRVRRRLAGEDVPTTYEIDLVRKDGTVFSVEVNASVIEYQGEPGDLVILRDITERKRAEARLYHLNEVLRAVRNVNQLITRERDPQQLTSDACAILVQTRGYRMAWIGLIEAGHPRVMPVARAGQGTDYLDQVTLTWDESETGQGPTGAAIRTRRPALCANLATDPRFAPWREAALQRGFASVAAAPVMYGERLFGVVDVYADKPGAFDDEEISLLAELAGDLGFALQSIEDEAERKRAEEALRESESKFKAVFENAPIGISLLDTERNLFEANLTLERITRVTKDGLLAGAYRGRKYLRPDGTDMPPSEFASARAINENQPVRDVETGVVTEDGQVIWTQVSATPLGPLAGRVVVITQDITERKRVEAQLAEQLGELRRWHKATLGRENRILDLKREVNELLARAGQPPRYPSAETEKA